jgi:hypothetical protein
MVIILQHSIIIALNSKVLWSANFISLILELNLLAIELVNYDNHFTQKKKKNEDLTWIVNGYHSHMIIQVSECCNK